MTISFEDRVASCARDVVRIDSHTTAGRKTVIMNVVDGQSNAQGGHGTNPNCPASPAGSSYTTHADSSDTALREMTQNFSGTGVDRIGATSSIYGFTSGLWQLYGLRSISTMSAWQGTALLPKTPNSLEFRWTVDPALIDISLQRSSKLLGTQVRNLIVPHHRECLKIRPDLRVTHRVCHWVQGEAEAPHLLSGLVTKAEYTAGLQAHWNWRKTEGFDLMLVHEHGRKGITVEDIAANEPMNEMVRQAQADFVESNPDVIWGSQASKSTGPLVVDESGAWVSGFEYATDDGGVHWTGDAQNAIGRLAAKRVAEYFNITPVA